MKKSVSEGATAHAWPDRSSGRDAETTRLVCGGLALAVVFLGLRIAGIWF